MVEEQKLREFFVDDVFARSIGVKIDEITESGVTCSLAVTPGHLNAGGAVQGGVIFTLADFAFAVAANHEKLDTVSLVSQINYLGQARGDQLFVEARCDKSGRTTCLYTIRVTDQEGRLVAQVATTGFITG